MIFLRAGAKLFEHATVRGHYTSHRPKWKRVSLPPEAMILHSE